MIRRLLIALLLLLPAPALGQSLEGAWALRLEGAIIFRFDLTKTTGGWSGTWSRPGSFASDGDRFGNIKGPVEKVVSTEGREIGGWTELTFPDDRPGAVPDVFRFNLLRPDRAEMIYAGTGLAPYTLERVATDAVLGPWDTGHVYRRPGADDAPRPPRASPPQEPVQGPPAKPAVQGR